MPMALKARRSGDGVLGDSVAGGLEFDLDQTGIVQEPDCVGATRGRLRGGFRRDSGGCGEQSCLATRGRHVPCTGRVPRMGRW